MRGRAIAHRAHAIGRVALLGAVLAGSGCAKLEARERARAGNVAYGEGRFEDAIALYGRALELEPDAVTVLWNRACAAEAELLRRDASDDLAARARLADRALEDFAEWLARLPEPSEADRRVVAEHRLSILAADRRCDELVAHWLALHEAHPEEEAWYGRIVRQYEACDRPQDAEVWRRKRTEDFPGSARAWHQRAIHAFEPLWPPAGAGMPYNPALSAGDRLRAAEAVLDLLAQAVRAEPEFRDAYRWRAMAYTQRRYARVLVDAPERPEEQLEALRAREDSMLAWMQLAALCRWDGRAACEPPPLSPSEYAEDHVEKLRLVAQLATEPPRLEEP